MKTLLFLIFLFYGVPWILQRIAQNQLRGDNVIRVNSNPLQKLFSDFTKRANFSAQSFTGKYRFNMKKIFIAIIVIIALASSVVTIPAGNTGVIHLFGKVYDREISSGIHFVNPFARVIKFSIRTEEYTMSVTQGEGQKSGADAIRALTNEGLYVDLDITVFYHLMEDRAAEVYRDLGVNYQEKIIRPEIRSAIRKIIAQYDSKAVYSEKRTEISDNILTALKSTLKERGIVVEQVLLRNVTLPPKLSDSIQEKLRAEQESQRYDFVLEKEKKEAERKRIEAEGQKEAQRIISESLTPRYLEYLYIRELKDRKGTIYVPTGASNGLPVFRGI